MNASQRPNILWLCSDQQRFDTLGVTGNEWVRTPHLDQLASEGALFERAYCQNPLCTPSRASFLTGRYPRATRCRQNGQSIPADEVPVTRLLSEAGYTCGLAGKLHLSACHPSVCTASERRINDGFALFHWSHDPSPQWPANEYRIWLRERGGAYRHEPMLGSRHAQFGPDEENQQAAWCAEKAISFIKANAAFASPWTFCVNFFAPHHPFNPPQSHVERYLEHLEDIPLPQYRPGELENKPVWGRIDHEGAYNGKAGYAFGQMSERDHRLVRAAYWAMCDFLDEQVGRILAALAETGQRENTIIIYMSDHGELLGDHGVYLKGPFFYEPSVRVPLLVSWPGNFAVGRRVSALTELVDIAPTLLEAAGLPVYEGMQGRSLLPILQDPSRNTHRDDVLCEYYNSGVHTSPRAYGTMLRSEQSKIVVFHGENTGELYDLEKDPGETVNLWDSPAHQAQKGERVLRLCDRMAFTADPLPSREAPW